ncbi:hypothetical protein CQW23_02234 [Capsicum baccatum]|uniref:Uncharacterized protein n=1 Tax=Capsicum baccatum TaxID=33114 RepID=A0A2G2XR89_CAPBA|nr:hypothetical protein CQW23_02234 [Capsicum baccatum]
MICGLGQRDLQTQRLYLQYFENMANFHDQKTLYRQLKIENDERYSPTRVLTLKVHPRVINACPLDRGSPDISLYLDKLLAKEKINALDFNKVINSTTFVLHSYAHDKESCHVELFPIKLWPFMNFGIPRLIQHVLALLSDGVSREVFVHDWVNFWFKGPEQYKEPPPWGFKHQAKPKSDHSPGGYIDMSFLP